MDNTIDILSIFESYEEITVKRQLAQDAYLLRVCNKQFVFFTPDQEVKDSRPMVYLYNDSGVDFPHIMLTEKRPVDGSNLPEGVYRFVCLYESESVVFSLFDFEEKIYDAVERLIHLLSMTRREIEREFQKEFLFYWNSVADKKADIYLPLQSGFSGMNIYWNKNAMRVVNPGIELSDLDGRKDGQRIWVHHIESDAFYIPVIDMREILPPHKGYDWSDIDVRNIVCGKQIDHISFDTFQAVKKAEVKTQTVLLVFGAPNDITFALNIRFKKCAKGFLMDLLMQDEYTVEPIATRRKDYSYMCAQIGNDLALQGKKILLIGAGSLGSYVAFELVKNGLSRLKIYDGDTLEDENILRWAYGGIGKNTNKASTLSALLNLLHPEIAVESVEKNIDVESLLFELNSFDMLISTVGNSDCQLLINRILAKNNCQKPVVYAWLEAGGQHSHILRVDYSKPGCYECLYTDKDGSQRNNRATIDIDTVGEKTIKNGCGGTRAAYGTATILRTTAALLECVQKSIDGKEAGSTLIDISPNKVALSDMILPMEGCRCCGNRKENEMS